MKEIFKDSDDRLEFLLSKWDKLTVKEKETLIETYWNISLMEKETLNDNPYIKHTRRETHINYLYYNSFLALNLYIKHKGDWSVLREDMKEISLLLWQLGRGQYAYSLFKHIGRDSRERKIILKGFHNNNLNRKECKFCGRFINSSNHRQHYMKCYIKKYNAKTKANHT